jgi:hypothetical protein
MAAENKVANLLGFACPFTLGMATNLLCQIMDKKNKKSQRHPWLE